MSFVFCAPCEQSGSRPGGDSLVLCFAKEKSPKKKATLLPATLRFAAGTLRCSVQPGSRLNSPAAQTIAGPDPSGLALLSAGRRGLGMWIRIPVSVPVPASDPKTPCGWACEWGSKRDQGRALFKPQASLRGPPLLAPFTGCPKGPRQSGRLSFR